MSRTDRDAPSWTRAAWWEPLHRCAALYSTKYPGPARLTQRRPAAPTFAPTFVPWVMRAYAQPTPRCDLPAAPDLWQYLAPQPSTHCVWHPRIEPRPWFQDGPTRRFILTTWTRPQRVRVRDECHLAIQHHRATGTVDVDPTTTDHRHTSRWLW
ncbi:hypothetical protein AB0K00_42945 [Dactylosporangium sp. NPDC049525]|uniref:hypothetical protein n=1 Tax=Dactylosporangium sp. NPDC049525 TaxID=3154730 RepID=UPI00343EC09F